MAHAAAAAALAANAAAPEDADYAFLVRHMPAKDRGVVSERYLRANVALAREARRAAPWRDTIDDATFREYVLPYSSIGEESDDWRPLFREKFWPLVRGCRTTGEAVRLINSRIWKTLGVRYSTGRDKPDQSPFHSMRIHKASCTGLAILEIDAYRSCGIPARFVGCNWTTMPGNHSWVEYYDGGKWHFFDDAEDGKLSPPDRSWFAAYAAQADASNPRTRIYASRWSPGPSRTAFWLPWRGGPDHGGVPADDVTASYARFRADLPRSRVAFVARDAGGRRVAVGFRLVDPGSGKVLAEGVTHGETHDANDHCIVALPERTAAAVEARGDDGAYRPAGRVEFGAGQSLVEIKAGRPAVAAGGYVVAADASSGGGWGKVVAALEARHGARVVRYGGMEGLPGLVAELRRIRPKYVCFVARPEAVGRDFVAAAWRAMRAIDGDPFCDAVWGIVTGHSAEDALKVVSAPPERTVRSVATSMGGPGTLDGWEAGFASDERTADNFWIKRPGGANEKVETGGDIAKALADAFNSVPIDYFATSGHASERDWQIIYNKDNGRLVHTKDAGLRFLEPGGKTGYDLTNVSLRVYIGAGNCLIGHVDSPACMATAWMRTAGVEQFAGYTVPSWYGFMGWGVKGLFEEGRYSLPEAVFLENARLVWAQRRAKSGMDGKGLAYDRDTFAFYGDPAQRTVFPADRTPYSVSVEGSAVVVEFLRDCEFRRPDDVKGARPVMALLDAPPVGDALLGADGREVPGSVVARRFLFVPLPGRHSAGERVAFRLARRKGGIRVPRQSERRRINGKAERSILRRTRP
ncbi:MAG: transglutaminase domain-containing protein [Kiritimatiellae bacterium]|nr:transglutaminase domain-containing protein [Kiritimatiellia bacterium]